MSKNCHGINFLPAGKWDELMMDFLKTPGMFSCAPDGLISDLFLQAGLKNISQTQVSGKLNSKTTDIYWNIMTEVGAPIVAALSKADEAMKEKIKKEVHQVINEKYPDGNVVIDSSALIIYGEK